MPVQETALFYLIQPLIELNYIADKYKQYNKNLLNKNTQLISSKVKA